MGRTARSALASLVIVALAFASRDARADDGDGHDASVHEKICAQMEKILRLMRASETALLEASRGGGKKPDSVDVKPPEPPPASAGASPPATAPGADAKKALDDLLSGARDSSGKVPHELEELVKMIPT
jgi:hypothetical protein